MQRKLTKIIHVDMDAFYAAIEQRDHPELRGKPVVVGGHPQGRGVVATCSYEARTFGIHSAMPAAQAYRLCPQAVFVSEPRYDLYAEESKKIQEIFYQTAEKVEPLSLDEAYLDVTRNKRGITSATLLARRLKKEIFQATGLTASAGVSYNKSLAKIASDWEKPDGLTVIPPEKSRAFLENLPVGKLWGVGPAAQKKLQEKGIYTCGQMRQWALWELNASFGSMGTWYYALCRGEDLREVQPFRRRKSLGKERTFPQDLQDRNAINLILRELSRDIAASLKAAGFTGRGLTLKVKYADFQQITRRLSLPFFLSQEEEIHTTALKLLEQTEVGRRPVRLLGISMFALQNQQGDTGEEGQLLLPWPREN